MFVLTEMKDIIRLEPNRFNLKMEKEVIHQLNSKYANKVCCSVVAGMLIDMKLCRFSCKIAMVWSS